ncbi:MAG TPA: hypothetical protein VLT33_32655 [Labilithrix sp.]|nr:hypothetical protein [Labilithrix sp.]
MVVAPHVPTIDWSPLTPESDPPHAQSAAPNARITHDCEVIGPPSHAESVRARQVAEDGLVGTSDARGCGKDIYYDALGRTVGEDFSPCRLSHADYTQGDPANPAGLEVYNTYDNYESGQVQSDGTFIDDPRLATGRLVSVRDRGAHTRFSYDDRGRVRRVARQVAKPASQQGPGIDPLAAHWYVSRSHFDNALPTSETKQLTLASYTYLYETSRSWGARSSTRRSSARRWSTSCRFASRTAAPA